MKKKLKQMKTQRARIVSLAVCLVMVMGMFAATPTMAKTKPTLIKSKAYYFKEGKKWKYRGYKEKFKYNKMNDPIKRTYFWRFTLPSMEKFKWFYENGKRKKVIVSYYQKLNKKMEFNGKVAYKCENNQRIEDYKYNKRGYINIGKYKYYKNGLPKVLKTKSNGDDIGKAVYYFNKKGLLTKFKKSDWNISAKAVVLKYKYDKKGRVKEAVVNPGKDFIYKVKYKYTNRKIDKKRYSKMINETALNEQGSMGIGYFDYWY